MSNKPNTSPEPVEQSPLETGAAEATSSEAPDTQDPLKADAIVKIRKSMRYDFEQIMLTAWSMERRKLRQGPMQGVAFLQRALKLEREKAIDLYRAFNQHWREKEGSI